ncbi:MAG: hypothetical protein HDR00_11085 [Lachnospiraceae bacterium]|nr:hypothetical protein [Lachnospiraceae bacterium]
MRIRHNLLFVGIAVAYCILFIIQIISTDLLPIQVYFFVAWASLELAVLELLKTTSLFWAKHLRLKRYIENQIENKQKKEIRMDKIVMGITELLSCLQYVFILVMAILTPLKNIPNNLAVNKQIDCLSLLSFSLIFLNLFFYKCGEDSYREIYTKVKEINKD